MSESQSRYSIVERLTNKKLALLDDNGRLDREIEDAVQRLASRRSDFVAWEKEVKEDVERESREKFNEIEKLESEIKFLKDSRKSKEETIAVKLTEIDKALQKLEAISKSANE